MCRAPIDRGAADQQMIDHEGQHCLGHEGDPHEHQDQGRLGQDRHHHRATRPDTAIGAAAVEAGQHDHERAEREDESAAQDVAHVGQWQRKVCQHRNQNGDRQHRSERDERRDPVNPGGCFRDDNLLMKELPKIAIGLENARTLSELHALLELMDDALQQRRQQQHCEHLGDLQEDIADDHGRLRMQRCDMRPHFMRALQARAWQTQSHCPAENFGGFK